MQRADRTSNCCHCHTSPHVCSHFRAMRIGGSVLSPTEGNVRQTRLIHRTQIWTLIRPRSPPMGEKDFPRGSSMTVLWVSICKNDVDFLFISAFRQKSAGQGHLELKKFLAKSTPYRHIEPDLPVMSEICEQHTSHITFSAPQAQSRGSK